MNWRDNQEHLAECPECFTANHFNMPEWRCTPCPRLLYQNASREWYQHLRNCDSCQAAMTSHGNLCEAGDALCDKEIDTYHVQNDAGCPSLMCPGKNLSLGNCPGV